MKNILNLRMLAVTAMSVSLLALTSCVKNNIESPTGSGENLPVFDFSTKSVYTLNVKYNVPDGYNVYFEVYAENPLNYDYERGVVTKKTDLVPIDKGYTNEKGVYANPVKIPAYVGELYIYSPNAGVPKVLVSYVKDGGLTEPAEVAAPVVAVSGTKASTKAAKSGVYFPNLKTNVFGSWDFSTYTPITFPDGQYELPLGRPSYLDYIYGNTANGGVSDVPAAVWKTINTALPGDNNGPVDERVLQSGDIQVKEEAELSLYIIAQECLYTNALAYYCYETANPPKSVQDIKVQTLAFPNASLNNSTSAGRGMGLLKGEGIKLKYCDAAGNLHDKFPAGTSVGWILYSNGFVLSPLVSGGNFYEGGSVYAGLGAIYSNKAFNGGLAYTTVFRHGDYVVTTFEDTKKASENEPKDYRDLMFRVASTPASAITPGIPDVDPEQPSNIEVTYNGILTFEDLWPYQGDFDMNDVVIKYASTVVYNSSNHAIGTKNKYTVLWSGADLDNSFAYNDDNMKGAATVTFEGGDGSSSVDMANNIVRVANHMKAYANKDNKLTFTVNTNYASPVLRGDFIYPPYNPFITPNSVLSKEVHLTNAFPTAVADVNLLGTGDDKSNLAKRVFYITYDTDKQQMPFAIDIAFASEGEAAKFVIPAEGQRVNLLYPDFVKWVKSGGKEYADWYLNPKK